MSISSRKTLFIFGFPLLAITLLGLSIYARSVNVDSRSRASDDIVEESRARKQEVMGYPYLVTLAPATAEAGSEFNYYLKVVDSDTPTSEISVELLSGPEWLQLNVEEKLLYGFPRIEISNTQEVVLRLSDGKNEKIEKFYILITHDSDAQTD